MAYPILDAWIGDVVFHRCFLTEGEQEQSSAASVYLQKGSQAWQGLLKAQDERLFYEVIRLQSGIPLFWDDHLARLKNTLTAAGLSTDRWGEPLGRLVEHAVVNYLSHPLTLSCLRLQKGEANLKIVVSGSGLTIYLTAGYYPTAAQFRSGVPAEVMTWERCAPHVKEVRADYKEAVADAFAAYGSKPPFEILLANRSGQLTEGSRSNLFLVKDKTVISPPEELILKGITRKYVLQAITEAGFNLREGLLTEEDLSAKGVDGAFISASPIDILPLKRIGQTSFSREGMKLAQTIGAAYQKAIKAVVERDRDRFAPGTGRSQNLY